MYCKTMSVLLLVVYVDDWLQRSHDREMAPVAAYNTRLVPDDGQYISHLDSPSI